MIPLLALAALFSVETMPLQFVQAAQLRAAETAELLDEALDDLEEGGYAEGEALVSMEAGATAALAKEGTYRYDSDITVETVNSFGVDEETGKETCIVHLTSDKYTTEELMEIALKQYYVDGVASNQYQQLMDADPAQSEQWYLDGDRADSSGISLASQTVTAKNTPVIAVLDTGVDYTHPDLKDSMWVNTYPGVLAGTYGYDFGDGDANPMDSHGHGTHVAGVAAATSGNGIGITGVSQAKIMALKVMSDSDGSISDAAIIGAYSYVYDAIKAGVNVTAVNCSWGGSYDSNGLLAKAVNSVGELGALSIFAAGNDSVNWDAQPTEKLTSPYDLNSPYTVIVGASDEQDEAAFFSDYGATRVDLFAPGSKILSTDLDKIYLPGVYTSAQQKSLTAYLNRLSDDATNIIPTGQTWDKIYTAADLGLPSDFRVTCSRVKNGSNGYLKLSVTRVKDTGTGEVSGSVYVDVTNLNLNQSATYYVGFLYDENLAADRLWTAMNMTSTASESRFVTVGGRTYMRIVGLDTPGYMGVETTCYLDDIAISVANPGTEILSAYGYMDGSSFSAPIVSAAVATLAAANPSMDASGLRSLLMQSVRKEDSLSNKCVTGGILDMSKLVTKATKVTLNKTSASLRYGKTLTLKAKVTPSDTTNTKVKWTCSNTKYATVTSKGVVKVKKAGIGHTVKITATAKDGSGKKATCKIKLLKKKK